MMSIVRQERLSVNTSAYAVSHCMTCAAGWTRTAADGKQVIVCLLDREPVWQEMTDCDRFEAKEQLPLALKRSAAGRV
jgi:hypothetical protein